jgi:hypothetical protein
MEVSRHLHIKARSCGRTLPTGISCFDCGSTSSIKPSHFFVESRPDGQVNHGGFGHVDLHDKVVLRVSPTCKKEWVRAVHQYARVRRSESAINTSDSSAVVASRVVISRRTIAYRRTDALAKRTRVQSLDHVRSSRGDAVGRVTSSISKAPLLLLERIALRESLGMTTREDFSGLRWSWPHLACKLPKISSAHCNAFLVPR